ncbi:MAG: MurR/RpiR family transcriptional regulator [Defluviitaleaceae bacterium]|nr:MurR/RpiR family transcriptional regulator [Defluviitaleaceae bacterium]
MIDFFQATADKLGSLNKTERQLFEYVVKNMAQVKGLSIQKFAAGQFLSTTTIFRFTQKLGFSGYADFINSLLVTSHSQSDATLPDVIIGGSYSEMYLKNVMESVRVMPPAFVEKVINVLRRHPNIYILTDDNTFAIGQYSERLFIGLGMRAYFPETAYQLQNLVNHIRSSDMIIALSYSGENRRLIDFIERVYLKERPFLMSITRADNNPLEGLSDANFYVFADEICLQDVDLTSSVPMLMVLEMLIYEYAKITHG